MYTPLNKTWLIVTFISQLTSEANPPRFTLLGDSYASSTNQPHPHSPSSNADAATNSTPYTPPSLSSSYVPLLPSPSYRNSFLSIFQSKCYSSNLSPFPFSLKVPLSTDSSQSAPSPSNSHSPSPAETFYFPVFSSDQNPYFLPEPTNTFPSKEVFPSDPYTTSFSTEADVSLSCVKKYNLWQMFLLHQLFL